ncbi:H(+)/Cl(-) exchange transporter 7-like isoform X3 [Scylla paramamosain]|uniref:H(+)/Cl(-) exchange transporter 7-like isoform X3 n=1 Tax=Scylla paramamosain TaxID=85552 RepID=UPI003082A570
MDCQSGASGVNGLIPILTRHRKVEEKEMESFPVLKEKTLKESLFQQRNLNVAAISTIHPRASEVSGEDVPDGCFPSSSKDSDEEESSEKVGNSIFYVDSQQESPSDENRGQLNMLSAAYESLDYDTCVNAAWLDEERTKGYTFVVKKDVARWLVVLVTAVLTALVGCCIDITIESLSKFKYTWLKTYTDYGVEHGVLIIPYLLWVALNIGPTLVAGYLGSYVEPVAAGSGIPQVKCYLNGVKVPRVVRIKTLVSKAVGVTMSVLGGLAVGKEGPMIHSGAVIAAGVSQGKTTSFKYDFGIFEYFREDHEKRDFVSAGAAAGVAAAFGAPVGGVLFSLEEGASFWNQALTWRVFFGAMMSAFTLNLVLSTYNGVPGKLTYNGLLNFGKFEDLTYEIWEFIPFLLMGVMGGLLGALYNFINFKLTQLRMRYITRPWQKVAEAILVASTTASVAFLMIYGLHDCRKIEDEASRSDRYPIQMYCNDGEESAVAAIWFQTPEKSVRSLFHDPSKSFEWLTLSVFFGCYFLLACWTYGLGIPSGLFIPTLLCGAAWGRLTGKLMTLLFPGQGLYDIHIQMQGVPIMAWDAPPLSNNIYASEVLNRPVTTLRTVEKVSRIVEILKSCTYNGFPVVDSIPTEEEARNFKSYGTLRGLILRSQLTVLLKHKVFNENAHVWESSKVDIRLFRLSYPRYFTLQEVDLTEEDLECTIDLRPFHNPSPYSVVSCTPLPRMFNLFRALGLRHLVVVNDSREVVGMVTRKDLVKYRVWKHRGQMGLEELVIYDNVA